MIKTLTFLSASLLFVPALNASEYADCDFYDPAASGECQIISNETPSFIEYLSRSLGFEPKRYALVVSVNDYIPESDYPSLKMIDDSSSSVLEKFVESGNFDEIVFVSNHQATKANLERLVTDYFSNKLHEQDTFVLYYIGHGDTVEREYRTLGRLALFDSNKTSNSSFLDMHELKSWYFDISHARNILFLIDACFSGAVGLQELSDPEGVPALSERGHHLITAGTKGQKSYGLDDGRGSFFSRGLVEALSGAADTKSASIDYDGVVTTLEIYRHLKTSVSTLAANNGRRQNPELFGYDYKTPNVGESYFVYDKTVFSAQLPALFLPAADELLRRSYGYTEYPYAGVWGGVFGLSTNAQYVRRIHEHFENKGMKTGGERFKEGEIEKIAFPSGMTFAENPGWIVSDQSIVYYYSAEMQWIANEMAQELKRMFGINALVSNAGAGFGLVDPDRNIFIHIVKEPGDNDACTGYELDYGASVKAIPPQSLGCKFYSKELYEKYVISMLGGLHSDIKIYTFEEYKRKFVD